MNLKEQKLIEENEKLREAYRLMRNSAAGYSNLCEDSANERRCTKEYIAAEEIFRSIIT